MSLEVIRDEVYSLVVAERGRVENDVASRIKVCFVDVIGNTQIHQHHKSVCECGLLCFG